MRRVRVFFFFCRGRAGSGSESDNLAFLLLRERKRRPGVSRDAPERCLRALRRGTQLRVCPAAVTARAIRTAVERYAHTRPLTSARVRHPSAAVLPRLVTFTLVRQLHAVMAHRHHELNAENLSTAHALCESDESLHFRDARYNATSPALGGRPFNTPSCCSR